MLKKDEWLSQYFDHGAYSYHEPFDEENLPPGFISAKLNAQNISVLPKLLDADFKLIQSLVDFEQAKSVKVLQNKDLYDIGLAVEADRHDVRQISHDAFVSSRFFMDSAIPRPIAAEVKAEWAVNYFNGQRGTDMVVARKGNKVIGFMLLIDTIIDLIAVHEDNKGQGIGTAMVSFANEKFGLLRAGTQLENLTSVNFYIKNNFFITGSKMILHRHSSP